MKLDDLISQNESQTPTYTWWLEFDVISAVDNEKKAAKEIEKKSLSDYLSKRSDMRKALRTWQQTTGNKDADKKSVNTSALADTFTEIMVNMGKDPKYMQETYWTSQWNLDLINKMKGIQWGKFSWDIQNYIDGRSDDLTWLVNNMFPDYVAKKTWVATQTPKQVATQTSKLPEKESNVLQWDTRSWWDKMAEKVTQFKWSDIWLESERQPIRWIANILWWFIDTTQKIIPWTMDIFNQLTSASPEKFNKALDEWYYIQSWVKKNAKEAYDRAVKYQWYKWSYNQWVEDSKKSYADLYGASTSNVKSVDESRWDWRFNTMDEESKEFKWWKLGSEVVQQIALDKWLTSAFWKWLELYKWYRWVKWAEDVAKWTELAMRWTELATKWDDVLANPKTMQESKNIAQKFIDWFNKPWAKQDITKAWLEWWKWGLEYQLIWDVQEWELSKPQAYWISAWLWVLLWSIFDIIGKWWKSVTEPSEWLRTSLKRLGVKDVDEVVDWAEAASKDHTLPSAKQRVTDDVVKEAKKGVKDKLDKIWQDLWNFRKNLWRSDIRVDDFRNTINKSLTKKGVWAQIVERDGKYIVEWYPWEYWEIMTKIVDRMNWAVENVKNRYNLLAAWEDIEIGSNTSVFEELLSDLKGFSIKEQNAEVKQKFYEIEKDLMEDLKWTMSPKQYADYEWLLNDYAKYKVKNNKVLELEWKMNKWWIWDSPKMDDWQYMSDFLEELYSDKEISKNAKDRRIVALFADAIYWVPLKPWERVPYPTKYWWLEEVQKKITKMVNLPKNKITWWWRSYAWDYEPSEIRKTIRGLWKQAKTTTVGKMASNSERE